MRAEIVIGRYFLRLLMAFASGVLIANAWGLLNADQQIVSLVSVLLLMSWLVVWAKGDERKELIAAAVILLAFLGVGVSLWFLLR